METNVEIRLASSADANAIAQVLRESFVEYQPLYTPEGFRATTPHSDSVLKRMSEGPAWIALIDGATVGTAAAVVQNASLYVRGMAVLPAARGHNIGMQLLREIEGYAIECGLSRMFLSTTPFLNRAIALYERYGFRRCAEGPQDLFGTPLFTMEKMLS